MRQTNGDGARSGERPAARRLADALAEAERFAARCGARTHIYGPGGNPLCADCRPVMPEARAGQEHPLTPAPAAARRDAA